MYQTWVLPLLESSSSHCKKKINWPSVYQSLLSWVLLRPIHSSCTGQTQRLDPQNRDQMLCQGLYQGKATLKVCLEPAVFLLWHLCCHLSVSISITDTRHGLWSRCLRLLGSHTSWPWELGKGTSILWIYFPLFKICILMLTYKMTVETKQVSQKGLAVKKSGVFPNLHNDKVNLKAGLVTTGR